MLLLANTGLKSADGIRLPRLQRADLSNNAISDVKSIARFVAACPSLEILDLAGNGATT